MQRTLFTTLMLLLSTATLHATTATIAIDASQKGPAIDPRMYGIFLEEINHGVDGGLYAELIRNRAFEDSRPPEGFTLRDGRWLDAKGYDAGFDQFGYATDGVPFWSLVKEGKTKGAISLETTGGVTEESCYCLRLDIEYGAGGRIGVANGGFFGIGLRQGQKYELSLYARGGKEFIRPPSVCLENQAGKAVSNTVLIQGIGDNWKQFKATLTASVTESKARLVILTGATGTLWLDFVSLFPAETWKGRSNGLRSDIAQMIADLKPGFVRFPGGCVVEGGTVETAYNWKDTVGPLESRPERWGPWNYRFTHGMGLHEYFQFCEDLGAEPLWVGFCGQTCIFRQLENVPMDQMGWVRDNFLDVVEYANGSTDSKWGKLRADAGHPAPFGLKYVEIGNENAERAYEERYRFIYDAMKAKYPDLIYLADLSYYRMPAGLYQIADRHYYNNPTWFMNRFNEYDNRDRSLAPLYLGEVAVTSQDGGPYRGNLLAALAEGVFLMGCERNADVVQMVSYAPLLAHVDGRTWDWHGMIYHDGTRVFGTASYYLWKLFGANRPSYTVRTDVKLEKAKPPVIAGAIGVGTWNTSAEFKDIRVEKDGQVLCASDFSQGAENWQEAGGEWTVQDGAYRQNRQAVGLSYFGDESWSDYTLTLKARKISGPEGFLVVFGRKGESKYWWNLGGWGNREHAIELNQSPVGRHVQGRIETNRWYDVKIELSGNRIRCYLDSELIQDVITPPTEHFYAAAGWDDANDDLIVKAINTTSEPVAATLSLQGLNRIQPDVAVTVLTSARLSDNNNLDEPRRVAPTESRITTAAGEFAHEFPGNSLTILRIRTQ
ncbi:MAG: alpha-L-arabinofuranosidase C-terminal domain-containing protein [Phycisphaerales bacterium]